jgi:hypothetical protein
MDPVCLEPPMDIPTNIGQVFSQVEDIAGLWGIYNDRALEIMIIALIIALLSSALFFGLSIFYWSSQYLVKHRSKSVLARPLVNFVNYLDAQQTKLIVWYNETMIPRTNMRFYQVLVRTLV